MTAAVLNPWVPFFVLVIYASICQIAVVARLVHHDLVHTFKYARVWGRSGFDGQHVGRDHRVEDGDIVELHA